MRSLAGIISNCQIDIPSGELRRTSGFGTVVPPPYVLEFTQTIAPRSSTKCNQRVVNGSHANIVVIGTWEKLARLATSIPIYTVAT